MTYYAQTPEPPVPPVRPPEVPPPIAPPIDPPGPGDVPPVGDPPPFPGETPQALASPWRSGSGRSYFPRHAGAFDACAAAAPCAGRGGVIGHIAGKGDTRW